MVLFSLLLMAAAALCIYFFFPSPEISAQDPNADMLPQATQKAEVYTTDPIVLVQYSKGVSMALTGEEGAENLLPFSGYDFATIRYYFTSKRMRACSFPFPFVPQYTLVFSNGLRVEIMRDDEYFKLNQQSLTLLRASSRPHTIYRTDATLADQIWQFAISQGEVGVLETAEQLPFGLYFDNTDAELGYKGCAYKAVNHYINYELYWTKGVRVTYSNMTHMEQLETDEVPDGVRIYKLEYRIRPRDDASKAAMLQDPSLYEDRGWVAGLQFICVFLQKEGSGGGNYRTYALGVLEDPAQWATPAAAGQAARSLCETLRTDAVLGNE